MAFIADLEGEIQFGLAYSANLQIPDPGNICAWLAAKSSLR
jgi:hypothetical protein